MGMSTHIIGFRPPDEKWQKMKAAWDALKETGMHWEDFPDELLEFFNHEEPDEKGIEVNLEDAGAAFEWQDDARKGFEVIIDQLPENVTIIRFYNSW